MDEDKITMVDISEKPDVLRVAKAEGAIILKKETIEAIKNNKIKKGDVFENAKLAVVNGVKYTPYLVFLAHPIPITNVEVDFKLDEAESKVRIEVTVKSIGKTGVELEAITGVFTGLMAVWDLCKYLEKNEAGQYVTTKITDIKVTKKVKIPL
ncbi:MAG: cyclic pyranopterin monophosphate synthase MoaC [Candidatus Odinarchaeia archaeon]